MLSFTKGSELYKEERQGLVESETFRQKQPDGSCRRQDGSHGDGDLRYGRQEQRRQPVCFQRRVQGPQ